MTASMFDLSDREYMNGTVIDPARNAAKVSE